jgi:hypothetical protein
MIELIFSGRNCTEIALGRQGKRNHNIDEVKLGFGGEVLFF